MVTIRRAVQQDVEQICDIFRDTYGRDYAYPQYYDVDYLTRMVYHDDTVLLVAEDPETRRLLGTASVLLDFGAYADLVGEFGRLAVRPEARGHGVGRKLMEGRLKRVKDRLHVGLSEPRVVHPFSQRITVKQGFAPVGFLPLQLKFKRRESVALCARYFGSAIELRQSHPRIIPEVCPLAAMALENCQIPCDSIVDEAAPAYPLIEDFTVDELTTEGYASLLRIQRGRVAKREIFGPLRLHYGMFKLRSKHSTYLVARRDGKVAGAIGFTVDNVENNVRIFELISSGSRPIRYLLEELMRRCRGAWGIEYVEADVSAYAPRMQRTLLELGFLPAAYIPALAFHEVERLDAVRMVCLLAEPKFEDDLIPEVEPLAELVTRSFVERYVQPKVAAATSKMALFRGLSDEQVQRLAALCRLTKYQQGSTIFRRSEPSVQLLTVLAGEISVQLGSDEASTRRAGTFESVGEMSLLSGEPHSASAVAATDVEVAEISHAELQQLIRQRPDIGVIVYRNLASGLSDKLRSTEAQLNPPQDIRTGPR